MGCGVCARRDRRKINSDLLTGESLSTVSTKYQIPKTTLHRHVTNCLHSRIGVSRPPPPGVRAAPPSPLPPVRPKRPARPVGEAPTLTPVADDRGLVSALTGVAYPGDLDRDEGGRSGTQTVPGDPSKRAGIGAVGSSQKVVSTHPVDAAFLERETSAQHGAFSQNGDPRSTLGGTVPPPPDSVPKNVPVLLSGEALDEHCFDQRLKGAPIEQIARQVGTEPAHVADAVERVIEKTKRRPGGTSRDSLRRLEAERLDRLFEALWIRAMDTTRADHLGAVDRVLRVMERRAKMEGVDIPTGPHTVNMITHPVIQPIIQQHVDMMRRAIEVLLPTGEAARVLGGLSEAGAVLADKGDSGFREWLDEQAARRDRASAILTTGEPVEEP